MAQRSKGRLRLEREREKVDACDPSAADFKIRVGVREAADGGSLVVVKRYEDVESGGTFVTED